MTSPSTDIRPPTPPKPRYDPLAEFNRPVAPPIDAARLARGFFAVALLLLGVGMCVWVIVMIHRALNGPAELAFLRRLTPMKPEDLAITLPAGTVQLPPATLTVIAYFLLVLLLAIAGKVAVALVREGSRLLRSAPSEDAADGASGQAS